MMFQKKSGFKIVLKAFSPFLKASPPFLAWDIAPLLVTPLVACCNHNPWCHYETWGPMCDASTWLAAERMQVLRYMTMTAQMVLAYRRNLRLVFTKSFYKNQSLI